MSDQPNVFIGCGGNQLWSCIAPQKVVAFVAALLALTDAKVAEATSTANILLTAARDGQVMLVTISLTDVVATSGAIAPHEEFLIGLAAYRNIDWDDVQAIADADGLSVIHESGRVKLRLPIATTER